MESNIIKIKGYYNRTLYPKGKIEVGTPGNEWGIVSWDVEECLQGDYTDFSIVVKGTYPETIKLGVAYTIVAEEYEDVKYGKSYDLIYVNQAIDFTKAHNMQSFLRTILSENQIAELYKVYSDPMPILEAHDIEGLKKVKGVGDVVAARILRDYDKNKDLSNVYIELNDYGFTPNMIKKMADHYKSATTIIDVVKNHPYRLIEIDGISFITADKIALKGGISPKSVERVEAYITFYLNQQCEDGNSYVTAAELINNIYNTFGGKDEIVEEYYDEKRGVKGTNIGKAIERLRTASIITVEDGGNKARRRVYLNKTYNLEKEIAYHLKRLLSAPNYFDYSGWESRITELEKKQGFKFADEQLNGIKMGLEKQVCLVSGLAGSGKSSLVSGILCGLHKYNFAQCALSGKAAARLQEVTGQKGSTIHRLLGYKPPHGYTYNEANPLPDNIIILDEVSLVGGEIFLDLLKAIPTGSKLIMLGDLGQLESVGLLNLANDLYESNLIPTVELKSIHRQAAESGIITLAHQVRNQQQFFSGKDYTDTQIIGKKQDMIADITSLKNNVKSSVIEWYKEYFNGPIVKKDIMNIQAIAPVKYRGDCCVYNLNNEIQEIVNPWDGESEHITIGNKERHYNIHKRDKVMCVKNNYGTYMDDDWSKNCPIYNGWTGIVDRIDSQGVAVYFPLAEGTVFIPMESAKTDLILGYASTVHKLQGSDIPVVIGAIDYSAPPKMLTNSLLYTLITRAKKMCVLVGQTGAVVQAISTNFVSTKRTFLKELLDE